MTKRGFLYFLILIFLLILSFGTGIKELHMIACFMSILFAYSLLSALLASLTLSVKHSISSNDVTRLDKVTLSVNFSGFVLLPVTGIIYITKPGQRKSKLKNADSHVFCRLPGICKKRFDFQLNCDNKGIWYIGIKKLRIFDVFGLISLPLIFSAKKISKKHEIRVFPKYYTKDSDGAEILSKIGASTTYSEESNSGDSVSGSRKYEYGDPFKRINWKQTARTHDIYVRNYELETNSHILIINDNSASYPQEIADISCDICATLNKYYINLGANVRNMIVRINSKRAVRDVDCFVKNDYEFKTLNNNLISVVPQKNTQPLDININKVIMATNSNIVHIITSAPSKQLLEEIAPLKDMGYIVNCIVPFIKDQEADSKKSLSKVCDTEVISVSAPETILDLLGGNL